MYSYMPTRYSFKTTNLKLKTAEKNLLNEMKVTFAAEGVEVSKNFEVEVKVPPGGRRGVGRIRGVY